MTDGPSIPDTNEGIQKGLTIPDTFHPAYAETLSDEPRTFSEIFPEDWFFKLRDRFQIPDQHLRSLVDALHLLGSRYLEERKIDAPVLAVGKGARKRFETIQTYASKIRQLVNELSPAEKQVLWSPQLYLNDIAHKAEGRPASSIWGHTELGAIINKDTLEYRYLRPNKIEEAMQILEACGKQAAADVVPNKGGQYSDRILERFIAGLRSFWIDKPQKNFTFGSHQGKGISESYDFCLSIVQRLDPAIDEKRLTTAVRNVRDSLGK